ncbi:MAG: hypothetical protein R3F11_22010 [Verrucomicrobiales bacterium]
MHLELAEDAVRFVAGRGYDPVGARPLKRAIQNLILDPLSLEVLEGKFPEGSRIRGTLEGEEIRFTPA